jgi:hypothetical protein
MIQILSPSFRNVPFNGIEWSFQLKDLGFNEKGEHSSYDLTNFDEEELNEEAKEELEMSEIKHNDISKVNQTPKEDLDSIDTNIEL